MHIPILKRAGPFLFRSGKFEDGWEGVFFLGGWGQGVGGQGQGEGEM
jgi:hypothetical protein